MAEIEKLSIEDTTYDIADPEARDAADKAQTTADSAASAASAAQTTANTAVSGLTDGSVTKVGTNTVGGTERPIYIRSGKPTELTGTVGGEAKPIYMSSGIVTACSSDVGESTQIMYMSSGTFTESTSTIGSIRTPIYLDNGTFTGCGCHHQSGSVSITVSAANTPTGVGITFSSVFASAPYVFTCPSTSTPGTSVLGTGVTDRTTSSATVYLTRANAATTTVSWIAFGTTP